MKHRWLLLALLPFPLAMPASGSGRPAPELVRIEGGTFRPLYAQPGETVVSVAPFLLDARPVTRAEFESFVREHPRWQRGRAPALFVSAGYLHDWASPTAAGSAVDRELPVTDVSWFAARAYCAARAARLPTTNEWEFAARADERRPDAASGSGFRQRALELALGRRPEPAGRGFQDVRGVFALHGGVMEWVSDFQSIFAGSDSRVTSRRDRNMTCAAGATTSGDSGDYAAFLRYAYRATVEGRTTTGTMGFRCARSAS
ncbi:MAG TPA: formylglycine-generating enzyme family protein [Longimicrobiales bacterium]|nr:formylglycine-generating enzyme family protein [Longimicrobiales bacterium]